MRLTAILILLLSTSTIVRSQKDYDPSKKYAVGQMQEDLAFLKNALEEGHPGYTWYTSKDTLDLMFEKVKNSIQDPMTEKQFSLSLEPIFTYVRCGHTIVLPSSEFYEKDRSVDRKFPPFFTYYHDDELYLTGLSGDTSKTHVGKKILSINGLDKKQIVEDILSVNTTDGYNQTHLYNVLNRRFSPYFRFLYEEQDSFKVELMDSLGNIENLVFDPRIDLNKQNKKAKAKLDKKKKKEKKDPEEEPKKVKAKPKPIFSKKDHQLSLAEKDSTLAVIDIRSFNRSGKKFYKKTFKYLKEKNIDNLVIDLRNNGGGYVGDALFLLSYLVEKPISLGAQKKTYSKLSFRKNLSNRFSIFASKLFLPLFTKTSKENGEKYFRIKFKPNTKRHFDGNIYVLINGGSFSASCIVGSYLQDQELATFIGRETGGGKNGSSAIVMPYLNLPHTKVRVRFPLYRVYHEISAANIGRGILPDFPVEYNIEAVLKKRDLDMEKVYELVKEQEQ